MEHSIKPESDVRILRPSLNLAIMTEEIMFPSIGTLQQTSWKEACQQNFCRSPSSSFCELAFISACREEADHLSIFKFQELSWK